MSTGTRLRAVQAQPSAEDEAERRRMSFYDLFFLAAGGVIGSGWLLGAVHANWHTGGRSVCSWLIGGALMLVIATVMVELSTVVPKTGGLIFLPLQSSGPLLATVLAAALWIFYALNPASEAVAMVDGLPRAWGPWKGLVTPGGKGKLPELSWAGIGWAALFLILIAAVNLLGPRLFLMINNVLTCFKIAVPLLIVFLLIYAEVHPSSPPVHFSYRRTANTTQYGWRTILSAVISSGMIYAYLGFQGPLTFAGSVKRRGVGEAARLRWAVYGTLCGSILLYVSLQFVVTYMQNRSTGTVSGMSAYADFAAKVAPGWVGALVSRLVKVDMVLSPAGAGMVFTYVLTREVAALSRAHLTHRGLQKSRYSVIPLASGRLRKLFGDDRLDVYWLILIVNLLVSGISLLCFGRKWSVLSPTTSMLALIIYSTQSVVLAALRRREPGRFPRLRYSVLAEVGFVSIGVVFVVTGWDVLWRGMAALTVGCLLLFGLPLVFPASRGYDATAHAVWFRQLRAKNPAARSAALLFGYFAGLALASLLWPPHLAWGWNAAGLTVVAVLAWITFRMLVTLSEQYMAQRPPTLPPPMPGPAGVVPPPSRGAATGRSG